MSTLVDFQPSTTAPFSFGLTLDGTSYVATITWNVFGQRYYLNLTDPNGVLILCRPVVASGPQLSAAFTWANQRAIAQTSAPHNVPVGSLAQVRVSGTDTGFDGTPLQVLATGSQTLTYPLGSNPNAPGATAGTVSFDLNLVDGAVLADGTPVGGWLLFHYESLQFEYSG